MENKITIICPKCKTSISVDEALEAQIFGQKEKEYEDKLEIEKKKMWAIAQEKANEKIKLETDKETKYLKDELESKAKKLAAMQEAEIELRKKTNQLDEQMKSFELDKQRQLDLERAKIKEETAKTIADENRLKDAENTKRIQDAQKQIEDLKRRLEQGSQQMQGEVLELELEETLAREFPIDQFTSVPKGINGADIIQRVHNQSGCFCGSIAWESKRTKAWSEGWIQKLKDDQRAVKADLAIIISTILPEGMHYFGFKDGVYIATPATALNLGKIIRLNLIRLSNQKSLEEGRVEKKEVLYNYLCGSEFRNRVEAIVEASVGAREILEKEKRAFKSIWATREKQIERIEANMIGIYGDMQGIAGKSLPEIKSLELPSEDELIDTFSTDAEDIKSNDVAPVLF
ncbi:MAG: DUF2130 domain-containing protein [bacterium]